MSQLGMRPRFVMRVEEVDIETCFDQIQKYVLSEPSDCMGMFRKPHMEIMFKPMLRKHWSPRLSLEFEAKDTGTLIRGLIAPQPGIWTLFMACYFSFIMIGFVGGTFGYSQWSLGESPWGFYLLAGAVAGITLVYVLSLVGQRMAFEQTVYLRTFLLDSLGAYRESLRIGEDS